MKKGFTYSIIFHLCIVLVFVFKIPHRETPIQPAPVSVDIVTEIPKKIVPAAPKIEQPIKKAEPVKKAEPPKPKPAPKKPKPKPKKVVKKTPSKTKIPVKKKTELSKEEIEKQRQEDVKKREEEQRKREEAERKKKEAAFASVLEDLDFDDAPIEAPAGVPLSFNEVSEIMYQITRCWTIPPSANSSEESVSLRVRLNRDGSLVDVSVVDAARYKKDTNLKLLAESALRAVEKCSPLRNLPPEKFSTWKDMELRFSPQDMNY